MNCVWRGIDVSFGHIVPPAALTLSMACEQSPRSFLIVSLEWAKNWHKKGNNLIQFESQIHCLAELDIDFAASGHSFFFFFNKITYKKTKDYEKICLRVCHFYPIIFSCMCVLICVRVCMYVEARV